MAASTPESIKNKEVKLIMASSKANKSTINKEMNKGAWTSEEDRKLAQAIEIHGAMKWKTIASKAGLNRCHKSCRLRWLNYLRPNIKRGDLSDQEEDLILRLHKLLGNRWSLIAGRLPGRTDNEIKNYWNSHLSKKVNQKKKPSEGSAKDGCKKASGIEKAKNREKSTFCSINGCEDSTFSFDVDDFFDFSNDPVTLELVYKFLEPEEGVT